MRNSRETHTPKSFRLLTLGGLALVDRNGAVVVEQRRRLALLALVAARGPRGMSRDSLMACLSPESPVESARHSLQQLIYYVRQQVGENVFSGTDPISIDPGVITSDVADFEAGLDAGETAKALTHYRGPFLAGFHLGDSSEFEEWAALERARLASRHADALASVAEHADALGDRAAAIAAWRSLAVLDPLNGRAALGLIRAMAAAGDREGAIRHAQTHEALVSAELGLPPDGEIAVFVAELRRGDPRFTSASRAASPIRRPDSELGPRQARERQRFAIAGGVGAALMLAVAAAFAPRSAAPPAATSPPRTAILPFRVPANDSGFAWLHEGMVDLLTIRLAGDGGIAVVEPGRLLAAWHREASEAEPGSDALTRVAASVGAQRIVEGSVVGTPARVVLMASLRSVPGDTVLARASTEGATDSMPALIDRLAAQLLGVASGVERDQLASLTSASYPAVRAFLAGSAAFRRGRSEEAAHRFRDAVTLDTTFALAGLGLLRAATWTGTDADAGLGGRRARAGRHRLSAADRAYLDAMTGRFLSAPDMFRRWNAAVSAYPDRPETWYGLGDNYFHWGMLAGIEDALRRAEDAFRRGWVLDSVSQGDVREGARLLAEPIEHLVQLAHMRGDTAEVRGLVARVLAADSTSDMARAMQWHLAAVNGATARRAFWREIEAAGQPTLKTISNFITWTGVTGADYAVAVDEDARRFATHDPGYAVYALTTYAYNRGRPSRAPDATGVGSIAERRALRFAVRQATWWDDDSVAAKAAEARLIRYANAPATSAEEIRAQYEDVCALGTSRARRGDHRGAASGSLRLRAVQLPGLTVVDSAFFANYPRLCAALLDASKASALRSPDARSRLVTADSLARDYIFQVCCGSAIAETNLMLARLWEAAGEPAAAVRALRRRAGGLMLGTTYMSTFLREEGRLAAIAGDTAGAMHAYRHYLVLRSDPEPSLRAQRDSVAAALRRLEGSRRASASGTARSIRRAWRSVIAPA